MIDKKLTCDVCGNKAKGVAASALGAFSFAYCQHCLNVHAEPYDFAVCTVAMCGGMGEVADWVGTVVRGTLERVNKTMEQFLSDVEETKLAIEKRIE